MVEELEIPSWNDLIFEKPPIPEGFQNVHEIIEEVEKDTGKKYSRSAMNSKLNLLEKEGKLESFILKSSQMKYYKRCQHESYTGIRPDK